MEEALNSCTQVYITHNARSKNTKHTACHFWTFHDARFRNQKCVFFLFLFFWLDNGYANRKSLMSTFGIHHRLFYKLYLDYRMSLFPMALFTNVDFFFIDNYVNCHNVCTQLYYIISFTNLGEKKRLLFTVFYTQRCVTKQKPKFYTQMFHIILVAPYFSKEQWSCNSSW